MAEISADAVIDRMREVVGVQTDLALGQYFGLGTSSVSNWRARNRVPYPECVILAERKGVSLDWLVRGLGEKNFGSEHSYRVHDTDAVDPRLQRMEGFLRQWHATHDEDGRAWLEMQLARAVPEYAEWMAPRK